MKKAIVMGSGFGGLASAVRLLKKGYDVTILEARDQLGGRASVFKKDGYTFDAGPTVITAPYLINELFEMLGENPKEFFELLPIDPFYRIIFNDRSVFDYVGDEDRLIENIRALNPQDVDGYRKLAKHAEEIFDVGYTQLADHPFDTLGSMARVIPEMIRLQNHKSVYALVSKYIKDERLRQAFSFEPLLVGGNPTKITSIYLLIHWLERKWGVHFIKGGTNELVRAFEKLLIKHGAKILKNKPVQRIDVKNGQVQGVITTDETYYPCEVLVSNADPVRVYRDMIDPAERSANANWKLKLKSQSMSLFVAYFGTKKQFPDIKHHTILMGPRYQGLLDDIFSKKVLPQDFSLYLHAPTRTDASMAPTGKECFYVLAPVPNNQSGINWKHEQNQFKDRVYNWLDKNYLPGMIENLDVDLHITPDYFEKELRSEHGAAFGIEPSLSQSAYFRFHNRSKDVAGLYFVGANTHPGAGVPGVLSSAKVIEKVVPAAGLVMA
ncbi:phytoene dehydrogenase [Bdellovibrio bacteriovorus]|uniref:Phytoene dehydrogenase n=1 Tax=Bdellovibrio bacteriovorus TaxID=959 RepID=A0A150WML2_BDEBC|nr:phytoene desaturase family protein [Bdellovibrio bacteriovorus]KYG65702.1 phytoene dehydrogenase [Bdellovibrio bacteriovorus]